MCEFNAYLKEGSDERLITEGIIRIKRKEGKLILNDVLGITRTVEGLLDEVDVSNERIRILKDPFIVHITKLLNAYDRFLDGEGEDDVLDSIGKLADVFNSSVGTKVKG